MVIALFILVGMAFTSLANWMIEHLAYRPLRVPLRVAPLISAIGLQGAAGAKARMWVCWDGRRFPARADQSCAPCRRAIWLRLINVMVGATILDVL